jgi:formylglycine-generating enzyme required for sulfatase activity
MTFDPDSVTPSPDFVDYIANTHRDALRFATFWARWGATEATKVLQPPANTCLLRQEGGPLRLKIYQQALGQEVAINLVPIPAGSFLMGSLEDESERFDNEGPQHDVTLGAFWMAQTPITQAQWRTVAGWPRVERDLEPDPSRFKGDQRPVERVNWHDAQEFCQRLSQRTGQRYGLPSEAQWEYACRAGTTTPFHFGATLTPGQACFNNAQGPVDVASFPANAWGLHDMHGNVWEWCQDQWHGSYEGAPTDGSAWEDNSLGESQGCCAAGRVAATPGTAARTPASSSSVSASVAFDDVPRLLRGGSWYNSPRYCRSAFRDISLPGNRNNNFGFRVCCLPQD